MRKSSGLALVALVALAGCKKDPAGGGATAGAAEGPWTAKVVAGQELYATITTTMGAFTVKLYSKDAPKTVRNFVGLATGEREWRHPATGEIKRGVPLYPGTIFHRVIEGFMIQGGDPLTKDEANKSRWGTGGPGYSIKAEFNDRPHVRGVLSMARANDPNSAGSQFFICHGDPRFLDGKYTAFGKLIKGDDVLEKIATTPTDAQDRPLKRIQVESIRIVAADALK